MIYPAVIPAINIERDCITQDGVKYCETLKSEVLGEALLICAGILVWFIGVYALSFWLEEKYDIQVGITLVVIGMLFPMIVGGLILILI